ncbi:MAG: FecR domain-containing protein [Rubrivivax sp.]
MADADPASAPGGDILQQAAEWFAVLGGAPAEAERRAWQRWLQADPRHAAAWRRVEALNRRFDRVGAGVQHQAARQALDEVQRKANRRRALKGLAGLGLGGGAAWLAIERQPWQPWLADASTAVGEQRELRLADGTRLWLNTDTAIGLRDDAPERRLRLLRGELMVQTAQVGGQPGAGPWRLDAAGASLTPRGTRFSARLLGAEGLLSVFDGAVELTSPRLAAPQVLHAGRQARFSAAGLASAAALEPGADGWTRGLLMVEGWTLARLCDELDRYQPGWISCAGDVAALRLVGVFPLADREQIYRVLERTLPVRVQRPVPGWVRIVAA